MKNVGNILAKHTKDRKYKSPLPVIEHYFDGSVVNPKVGYHDIAFEAVLEAVADEQNENGVVVLIVSAEPLKGIVRVSNVYTRRQWVAASVEDRQGVLDWRARPAPFSKTGLWREVFYAIPQWNNSIEAFDFSIIDEARLQDEANAARLDYLALMDDRLTDNVIAKAYRDACVERLDRFGSPARTQMLEIRGNVS